MVTEISHARRRDEPTKEGRKSQHWKLLRTWVDEFGWTSGAEIGLQRGWTICHLLKTCTDLHMIGVDQWLEVPDTGEPGWQSYDHIDLEYWAEKVKSRVAAFDRRGRILHMSSVEAAKYVQNDSLDFVFIDGDHSERGLTEDLNAWMPKVKQTGYVCGHDWQYPLVVNVLDKMLPGWERHGHQCWRIPKAKLEGLI